jgi:DNA mismatch repair protein MSH4
MVRTLPRIDCYLLICITALKNFIDAEKVLADLITIPSTPSTYSREQAINRVIMLKQFVKAVPPVYEALAGFHNELLLQIAMVSYFIPV